MSSVAELPPEEKPAGIMPDQSQAPVQDVPDPTADWPLTIIERRSGWQIVDWKEIWRYRELLFFLTWRDIKVRYKQTVLGAAWAVLQPLANMIVFTLFLGRLAGIHVSVPYPLFVFVGMLAWTFFSNAITSAGTSVVGNQNLVTKIYFPRLIIPTSAIGASFVDFLIGSVLLLIMQVYYIGQGEPVIPGWGLLVAPVVLLALALAALGVGTLLSALTVAFRDFRYVVPFTIQLWMFATPAIYLDPEASVGPMGRAILPLNPAYGLIYNFRQALLGQPLNGYALAVSTAASVVILIVGCLYFKRVERSFADII